MSDGPWLGDAVSLVDAFRAGQRHPSEELEATLAAVEASQLNAVCHIDADAARRAAAQADVEAPFGGVPLAVKELRSVAGWPLTQASLPLADRRAEKDSTVVARLRAAGAIPTVQTTSSEFGGVNQTTTPIHGATRNPWNTERTPGGSSGGSAAGVSGGLFALATGSDGCGSIRVPAGFTGLVGLKPTYGRVPKGPDAHLGNITSVWLCVSRSVRDTARFLDVVSGFDSRDPLSLPRVDGWERDLGTAQEDLRGLRVAVVPDLGTATISSETEVMVAAAADELIAVTGMKPVDVEVAMPSMTAAWALTGAVGNRQALGDLWPECAPELTGLMRLGIELAYEHIGVDSLVMVEESRTACNEAMADMFDSVDVVIAATNPHTAFGAEGHIPSVFGDREADPGNNGALTIPANIYGSPAISVPIGLAYDGLPMGMQILAPHHREDQLLDIALAWERHAPWPLTAPGAPC